MRYTRRTVVQRNRRRCPGTASGKERHDGQARVPASCCWSRRVTFRTRRRILRGTTQTGRGAVVRRNTPPARRRPDRRRLTWCRGRSRPSHRRRHRRHHRLASLQPHAAGCSPGRSDPGGRGTGSRDAARIRGGVGASSIRGPARGRAVVLRASRENARLPARARPHAAGVASRGRGERSARDAPARRSRSGGAAGAIRSAVRRGGSHRSGAVVRRRDARARRRRRPGGPSRCCSSTFRSNRTWRPPSSRR